MYVGKLPLLLCFTCIRGQIASTSPSQSLYSEGRFNGAFWGLRLFGGLYLEGLIHGAAYFRNFTVIDKKPMVYYTGKTIEKGIQTTSHTQNRPVNSKERFWKRSKTKFTYPALLSLKKRWFPNFFFFLLNFTIRYRHSLKKL